jgi:hypothetical protein
VESDDVKFYPKHGSFAFLVVVFGIAAHGRTAGAAVEPSAALNDSNRDQDATRAGDRVRVGVLGGIGFPRPLSLEGFVKIGRYVALGGQYSLMPASTFSDVHTSLWALSGEARVFPFGGALFVGAGAGEQHLGASGSAVVPRLGRVSGSIDVDTWFVNPRVGFLWTFAGGLTVGVDAGVQIPVSVSQSAAIPTSVPANVLAAAGPAAVSRVESIRSIVDFFGSSALPTVDLVQVGLLF